MNTTVINAIGIAAVIGAAYYAYTRLVFARPAVEADKPGPTADWIYFYNYPSGFTGQMTSLLPANAIGLENASPLRLQAECDICSMFTVDNSARI